jgi:hypothetical protein
MKPRQNPGKNPGNPGAEGSIAGVPGFPGIEPGEPLPDSPGLLRHPGRYDPEANRRPDRGWRSLGEVLAKVIDEAARKYRQQL